MNLLIITQKVDEEDDLLGFFVSWIREFALNFDKIFVITLGKGKYNLPENVRVYSLGKESGSSRLSRFLKFYFYVFKFMSRVDGVFAHMSPIFAIASWPAAAIFGKKIVLWYLHRSITRRLRVAEKLCYKIATAAKESLNLKSPKIIEMGHGIAVERFKTQRIWSGAGKLQVLSVGRISKIKNYETLLAAGRILKDGGINFEIKIIGRPIMPPDFAYFESLKSQIEIAGLKGLVNFAGFVPYAKIADNYQKADVVVNLTPKGGIDKVVLEAMASGVLVLTSNVAFAKYFRGYSDKLVFKEGDADDLVRKLEILYYLPPNQKSELSRFLTDVVARDHNLNNLIDGIYKLYQ